MGTTVSYYTRACYTFLDALGALGGTLGSLTAIFAVVFVPLSTYQFFIIAMRIVFPKKVNDIQLTRKDFLLLFWANAVHKLIPKPSIARRFYSQRIG